MGQAAGREGARPRGTCARAAWAGGTRRPRNFVRAGPGSGTRELRGDGAGAPPRAPRGLCVRPRGQLPSRARRPLRSARAARDAPARPRGGAEPRTGAGCERGAGGPGGFGRSGGPAAMFLRGGLRAPRAGGGGHGGDCAPPPIVPGLGLGPRAASALSAPLPPPEPGRGARGTQRTAGSDLPPPGGRAGNPQGPPAPLCDMCCRPGLHERGGYLAGSRVPVRFSLDKLARRGENWRAQQGSWFLGDQREENEQRATRITAVGETTLYPGVQPRGPDWGRGGED